MIKLEVDIVKMKTEVTEIKMAMAEDWKVFGEVKIGFDEIKNEVVRLIVSQLFP